jgi:hypothetical protein
MSLRIWICALALILVAVAGVALAEGGIPGPDGVINACRKIKGGRLRAVPSVTRCRSYERPLRWNVRGPVGRVGPTGPPGPAGPQGEPGPGLTSFDALAGLPCTVGSRSGAIAIDYDAVSGDAHIRCVMPAPPSALLRINEFSTGVEGALTDEFVEIVNAGTEAADLSGYAGAHPADRSFATSLASAGGGVGLRDPSGVLADSVAWGTATNAFVEGAVAPAPTIAPAPGKSAGRHPNGQDTNDNAADFTEGEPSPGGAN